MTPAAITPAGRETTGKAAAPRTAAAARTAAPAAPGHRHSLRPQPAPKAARRVSGPRGGRAAVAGATAGAGAAPVAGRVAAPYPRRARRRTARRNAAMPLGARALAFVRALPDHSLLDRIVRGRTWIAMLGLMLAGIVAMQVEVLKLGAGIGRSIQSGTALQSRNELLRTSVASLADDQRIERLAAARGMVMPAPDGVGFLSARSGTNAQGAIANIHSPNGPAFLSLISANGAVASGPSSSAPTALASASQPGTSTQTTSTSTQVAPAGTTASTGVGTTASTGTGTTASTATGTTASTGATTTASAPSSTSTSGQAGSAAGAAAPTQVAPTQTSSSQTGASGSGGAAVPVGG